jgi:predicted membrane protein
VQYKVILSDLRFLMAVSLKITVLWNVTPCSAKIGTKN